MNVPSVPQRFPRGKPGRRLGPIADGTGPAHRAWLEPLREAFHASGMTLLDLQDRTGWPKSKLSELLRAVGRYPRWAFARDVAMGLSAPVARPGTRLGTRSGAGPATGTGAGPVLSYASIRLLWVQAAREADKRTAWINECLSQGGDLGTVTTGSLPLEFSAFRELHQPHYTAYAGAFLRGRALTERTVDDVFLLLMLWDEALASENPERFAWQVLRGTVLERAPKDGDGHPALADAAFDTVALRSSLDPVGQLEESMALFRAVSRLPPRQMDVTVLLHLRGLDEGQAADELGISRAAVRSTARHARRGLRATLGTDSTAEEGRPGDLNDR
ncbi:sigma-70 family RNA polymerase sigma factor [Streptomyces sp. TRM64462]|uniref:sigma-70 family RNA polymerase sigma factor n=1 Tax=Streptomyces sp. TRM64462 TaxID=2741726 RepID=UPI001586F86B|nr:sigma-70 family RNA polymerase sigma factor [Streptomyces sp. TRM64462]